MRFSVAAAITMAAGAFAGVVTETVTDYTTYCPEATSIVHGGSTYSVPSAGTVTLSNGPYTVTRPLVTQTVTQCNKCTSSTAAPTMPAVSPSAPASSSMPVYSSTPLVPSGADATGAPAPSSPSGAGASTPAPSQPAFNAGTMNAAGAGAGLAAVFGAAALLL